MSKPESYTNASGETVMTLRLFKMASFEAIHKAARKPYPRRHRVPRRKK